MRLIDEKDRYEIKVPRESHFLEVYIHPALALVLSPSLSTEHHKAGADERSVLGDRDKRGWQLKQKTQQRCSMMHIVYPVYLYLSFSCNRRPTISSSSSNNYNCHLIDFNLIFVKF